MSADTASELALRRLSALPHPMLWVLAARLKTLSLSLVPVATGTWAAAMLLSRWSLGVMLAAMGAAALIQIGTNLWNDAADGVAGADGAARLGPARMTGLGLLDAGKVRLGATLAFAGAALLGLWLSLVGGPRIIGVGMVSLALGYAYSMGPRPLSHTPAGELLVVAFFGIVAVAGTVFLHAQATGAA
ncbi:MAG TPA: 1,4-dihydroxy-2-naphthoate octaprenyltransferase, partial [Aliiroseovarius sp.]|nr:1,4-dihydroxy-2-naphthoate octaprenyltransferase [Aliiroseovarius sp.]